MTKTVIQIARELIQEVADDTGFDTRDYSGRSMYGKECIAVSDCDTSLFMFNLGLMAAEKLRNDDNFPIDAVVAKVTNTREDSLGMGRITYWPGITFKDQP